MILQSGIYIFVTNNTLEGQGHLKIQNCYHKFVASAVWLSTFIYRCKYVGVFLIITSLVSQSLLACLANFPKVRRRKFGREISFTFPFERLLFNITIRRHYLKDPPPENYSKILGIGKRPKAIKSESISC